MLDKVRDKILLKETPKRYRDYYFQVCNKRILFYNAINNDNGQLSESAYNFLFALRIFENEVPRKIIREQFENFKNVKGLVLEILKEK